MAIAAPTTPFVWGAGGSMKTPDQIAREREIAAALLQGGMDYSPVDHWLAGAARAAQAGVGALKGRWADEAENAGREGFQSRWDSVFGGGATPVAADPVAAALVAPQTAADAVNAVGTVPSGSSADYIRQGLVGRGLPEHVADAFILNFKDESGLNPGINEAQPLVPGSRGGYGLYQLTGPRRTAYEQYAAQRGVDPANVDAQLDFMMSELQGPEASAYRSIMAAPDTGSAAAAIVNEFLRPAEEHRARRAAAYMGGAVPQVAQANTPDIAALLGLASDPWANETQRSIINSLVGQQLEQQAQANDPLRQLQIERAMLENDALRNPAPVSIDPTSGMQNYQFLVEQGIDPAEAIGLAFGGGGTTINNMGNIPAGYTVEYDDQGRPVAMSPVPGSPAAMEADAAALKENLRSNQATVVSDTIVNEARKAREAAQGFGATGIGNWLSGGAGFTPAGQLNQHISALKSIAAAENINAMRQASPTGGALGNASDADIKLLQDKAGALDPQSPEFATQLDDYERTLLRIVHGAESGDRIFEETRSGIKPNETSQQVGLPAVGAIEDGYRFKGGDPADPSNWERVQ